MKFRMTFILLSLFALVAMGQEPAYQVFHTGPKLGIKNGPHLVHVETDTPIHSGIGKSFITLNSVLVNDASPDSIWVMVTVKEEESLDEWETTLRGISNTYGAILEGISLQIPKSHFQTREGLFQVKRLATAAKSESPETLIGLSLDWQMSDSMFNTLKSYIDAYWISGFEGQPEGADLREAFDHIQQMDPGSGVYLADVKHTLWGLLRPWGAFFKGVYTNDPDLAKQANQVVKNVGEGYLPAYRGLDKTPAGREFLHLTVEDGVGSDLFLLQIQREGQWVNEILPADPVASARVEPGNPAVETTQGGGLVRFSFQATESPLALLRTERKPDPEGQQPTSLMAQGEHVPPVEWIMARVQARARAQQDHLRSYVAEARVTYQYEVPGINTAIDVDYDVRIFMEQGKDVDWELLDLYINGVRWTRGAVPELPMFEPGQVVSMPLDLELDDSYDYTYLGRRTVEGRTCYQVEFSPKRNDVSLFKGKVWVDTEDLVPVQIQAIQTNVPPPLQSSEQEMIFLPIPKAGFDYWLPSKTKGQELVKFSGTNVVARRKVSFSQVDINPENFSQELKIAQDGDHPFVRKTQDGVRYLERLEDGTLKPKESSFGLGGPKKLWLGGVYWDSGMDFPVPLAGFNYTDLGGAEGNRQINLFLGGAINNGSISWPHLFDNPKWNGYLKMNMRLIPGTDRVFSDGIEDESLKIKSMSNSFSGGIGRNLGEFAKIGLEFRLGYLWYGEHDDTDPAFVVPQSTMVVGTSLSLEASRWGYNVKGSYGFHRPLSDKAWGLNSENLERKDFRKGQVTAGKIWRLKAFQQIGLNVTWAKAWDADRFSRFSFGLKGPLGLSGFKGSGIRFTDAHIARLAYQFNLANIIRFGVTLDHARIRSWQDEAWESHTGIGFSGTFQGPKRTLVNLDLGYALDSEFDSVKGDMVVSLVFIKMF